MSRDNLIVILILLFPVLIGWAWICYKQREHAIQPTYYEKYQITIKNKLFNQGLMFIIDTSDNGFYIENCNYNGRIDLRCKYTWDKFEINNTYSVITTDYVQNGGGGNVRNNGVFVKYEPDNMFIDTDLYTRIVYMEDNNTTPIINNFHIFDSPWL